VVGLLSIANSGHRQGKQSITNDSRTLANGISSVSDPFKGRGIEVGGHATDFDLPQSGTKADLGEHS